jgi:AbiV family abortive infection protein
MEWPSAWTAEGSGGSAGRLLLVMTMDEPAVESSAAGESGAFEAARARAETHFAHCVAHARDLASAADLLLGPTGLHHVAFSLSVLAFEELGKATMIGLASIVSTVDAARAERLLRQLDDHEKKLFWAFWSPWGVREKPDRAEKIGEFQNIASKLHQGRLAATYVGADSKIAPSSTVSREFAASTVSLLKVQIDIAESTGLGAVPEQNRELLAWLLEAVDNKEKKPFIFGGPSMAKQKELGNPFEWARWLKQQFDDAERRSEEFLAREIARDPAMSPQPWKPKWRVTISIDSSSHSIRKNAFDIWNQHSQYIKLSLDVNRKEKNRFLAEIELPALIGGGQVWHSGWEMAHTLILAFNIGSLGLFWWQVPARRTDYYKKIMDLESNSELKISVHPAPVVDFGNQAFTQHTMSLVTRAYAALHTERAGAWSETLKLYLDGLRIVAKTDIHLRGETSAFAMFARAFNAFLRDVEQNEQPVEEVFGELLRSIGMNERDPERATRLTSLFSSARNEAFSDSSVLLRDVVDLKLLLDWQLNDYLRRALEAEIAGDPVATD